MHQNYRQLQPQAVKLSKMSTKTDFFVKFIICLQIALAAWATYANISFEHGNLVVHQYIQQDLIPLKELPIYLRQYKELALVLTFFSWMLRLVELVPTTLLVGMELIRYF
jgi:hypothetical protein